MISFDCPHCGHRFQAEDGAAGQDGWCRACLGVLTVPHEEEGGSTPINEAPLDEQCERLTRLVSHAARKNRKYKSLLFHYCDEDGMLLPPSAFGGAADSSLEERGRPRLLVPRLAASEARVSELEDELAATRDHLHSAEARASASAEALEDAIAQHGGLSERVESLEEELEGRGQELADAQDALARVEESERALRDELAALGDARTEAEGLRAELEDANQRIRTLEDRAQEAREEKATLQTRIDELDAQLTITGAERDHARDRVAVLEERVTESGQELEQARQELEDHSLVNANLAAQLEQATAELNSVRAALPASEDARAFVEIHGDMHDDGESAQGVVEGGEETETETADSEEGALAEEDEEDISSVDDLLESYLRFIEPDGQ